jgi:folate-binding protein YgfZ
MDGPMKPVYKTDLPGYQDVHTRTVFFPQLDAGYLRIFGQDKVDFIQRQSTNDVHTLSPEGSILTVLTSSTARILDVLRLVSEDEVIAAITLPGFAEKTFRYLTSRIFFMDKVKVENASSTVFQLDLEGAQAAQFLKEAGISQPPGPNEVVYREIANIPVRIIGQRGLIGTGFRLLGDQESGAEMIAALLELGAVRLTLESYNVLRVEAGLPAADKELNGDYTPLEANLREAISNNKGCYTGQEIIARQITYDKVTQHLVGLRLEAPVKSGDRILAEGKPCGTITSAVESPSYGPIALGIVKRPYHLPSTNLSVRGNDENGDAVPAQVSGLPFQSSSHVQQV